MNVPRSSSAVEPAPSALTGPATQGVATLDSFVVQASRADGVAIKSVERGRVIRVRTWYSVYRLLVLDPVKRHVLVTGGTPFPELTEARVDGATQGGSSIRTGWVGVGLRLEICDGAHRVLTSPVRSVSVERAPIG
jgi:hypothetical protein